MTDIHGNPEPRRVFVPIPSCRAGDAGSPTPTPYAGLGLLVIVGAVVAFLYVVGLFGAFPRSGLHDAVLAVASGLCFAAGTCWEAVERIPRVGTIVYLLPGLALAVLPFAIDSYLMCVR